MYKHNRIQTVMRTYGKNVKSDRTNEAQRYRQRTDTEWDIRCTLHSDDIHHEADSIVQALISNQDRIEYGLVGGIEFNHQDQHHVHIAVIFKHAVSRNAIMQLLGRVDVKNEYCSPRNRNWSYAGWKQHHIKSDTKYTDVRQLYEYGSLPAEQLTTAQWKTCIKYGGTQAKPTVQARISFQPVKKQQEVKVKRDKSLTVKRDTRQGDRHAVKSSDRSCTRTPERVASAMIS